jgi:hypothetical protein
VVAALVALLVHPLAVTGAVAQASGPVEDYASYQPQKKCRSSALPGTKRLARWIDRRYDGGRASASIRACGSGGTSEHKDGRAIDWSMNAAKKAERREVRRFLDRILATDEEGNEHALARRMGVMYVIWNDHMYASYHRFEKRPYRSSSCPKKLSKCSATLRHRDHVHLSLSRPGARARTSWYQPAS